MKINDENDLLKLCKKHFPNSQPVIFERLNKSSSFKNFSVCLYEISLPWNKHSIKHKCYMFQIKCFPDSSFTDFFNLYQLSMGNWGGSYKTFAELKEGLKERIALLKKRKYREAERASIIHSKLVEMHG